MKQLIFAAMIPVWANTALPVSAQVASPPPTIEEVSAMASSVNKGAGWTPPGSSSKPEPTMSGRILLTPTPAGAAVIEIAGKKTSWGALTQQEMRGALDVQDENVKVE